MTRMSRDRLIISGLVIAIFIEVALLLLHAGVLSLSGRGTDSGLEAGRILKAHNHLRRRNVNSLVWETSQIHEPVYYHDSILTLKESSATLELNGTTDISLSENTLITIDPPDGARSGEIRLRFQRGGLEARNPFHSARVHGDEWSLSLKPGTDIDIRDVGDKNVEVRLKGGQAALTAADGEHQLQAGQILRVSPESGGPLLVDEDLSWEDPPESRVYTHAESVAMPLSWSGAPETLVIQSLGRSEQTISLRGLRPPHLADLPRGNHRLYLRRGNKTSNPLDLQVWRAPVIHLLTPLPRNRVDLGEKVVFAWLTSPEVPLYEITVTGDRTKVIRRLADHTHMESFTAEDDVQWFITGIDHEGFRIPPLYRYPLFIRERPLAPPKLKTPTLRAPAAKSPPGPGAWLWSFIVPAAQAEPRDSYEADFAWEGVPGADHYVIEISTTPDFRTPVVNTVVKGRTNFIWRGFRFEKYHWRVAAGGAHGRMGVFSEPTSVDFSALKAGPKSELNGVRIRQLTAKVDAPKAQEQSPPTATPSLKTEPAPPAIPRPRALLWQPRQSQMEIAVGDGAAATLSGASPVSFGVEWPLINSRGDLWLADFTLTEHAFKPANRTRYPFQGDLRWLDLEAQLIRMRSLSGVGLTARQMLKLKRSGPESIGAQSDLWIGPTLQHDFPLKSSAIHLRGSALFSRDGQAVLITPEWRIHAQPRWVTGAGLETMIRLDGGDFGWGVQGFITLGVLF